MANQEQIQQTQTTTETKALQTLKEDISAQVLAKVDTFQRAGALRIPKNYSPENALKSAYIILSEPKNNLLARCSKDSIAKALLKMVVYGLSPLKGQCYFIPYQDKLECTIDYTGNIALAKRYGGLKSVKANAIFEGDEFEFIIGTDGRRKVEKHKQTLQSIGTPVVGAYAITELEDGTTDVEVMSIDMIQKAWAQGGAKGASPAHKNFTDQMAIKTVINRACKLLIRSSDDRVLYNGKEEGDTDDGEIIDAEEVGSDHVTAQIDKETADGETVLGFEEPEPTTTAATETEPDSATSTGQMTTSQGTEKQAPLF